METQCLVNQRAYFLKAVSDSMEVEGIGEGNENESKRKNNPTTVSAVNQKC